MADIALITAIYGAYDELKPLLPQTGVDVEWILVTDTPPPAELAEGWTIVHDPQPGVHPSRAAKNPKLFPWDYTAAPASVFSATRAGERCGCRA